MDFFFPQFKKIIRLGYQKKSLISLFYIQTLGYNMSYMTFQFLELADKFSYNIFSYTAVNIQGVMERQDI